MHITALCRAATNDAPRSSTPSGPSAHPNPTYHQKDGGEAAAGQGLSEEGLCRHGGLLEVGLSIVAGLLAVGLSVVGLAYR
jgi:hypothetical protein